jgi:glutamate dehydrogenase
MDKSRLQSIGLESPAEEWQTVTEPGARLTLYAAIQDLPLSRMVWCVRNVDFEAGLDSVIARFGVAMTLSVRAFSSEVGTGSRQENASNQESGAPSEQKRF